VICCFTFVDRLIDIALGIAYYADFTLIHIFNLHMQFLYLLFMLTDITNCVDFNFMFLT